LVGGADLTQAVAVGVLQGGFYALAAAGFSLIFGVQKILNVAHGAFIVLGAFLTIQFSILVTPLLKLDPMASLGIDFVFLALLGAAVYILVISRIEKRGFEGPLLATFGLSQLIEYVIANGLGPVPPLDPSHGIGAQAQNQAYSSSALSIGGVFLPEAQLVAFAIAVVSFPVLQLFLSRTYSGRALRATADDWEAAEFSGVNTRSVKLSAFALGSGLAGVAGGLFAFTNSVNAGAGDGVLLPVILVVVVVGGLGSLWGTLVAGLAVGVLSSVFGLFALSLPLGGGLHSGLGALATYLVLLGVLAAKPSGFFGGRWA